MSFKVSSTTIIPYGGSMHLVTSKKAALAISDAFGGIPDFDGSTLGTTATCVGQDSGHFALVFVVGTRSAKSAALVDTCAHEAAHGAAAIAEHFRLDVSDPGAEHYAYLLGYIAGWLWREVTNPQDEEEWDS